MKHWITAITITGAATCPVLANVSLSISLPEGATMISERYGCEGSPAFDVRYVNAGANNLAILPVEGEERIFVNVVSGSGARYVSGQWVWWSKGDTASLENTMTEGSLKNCQGVDD